METSLEIKKKYINLIKNCINFYTTQGINAGLGENHFNHILKIIIDKVLDSIFSIDEIAQEAENDFFDIIGQNNEIITREWITILRNEFVKKSSLKQ